MILTELGGGLLVLLGLQDALGGGRARRLLPADGALFHLAADETIEFQKNVAMAGGFLVLATFGPGAWSIDGRLGRAGMSAAARMSGSRR